MSCEQLIREVLRNDLGIAEGVDIEQVRRVGNAILVTFQFLEQKVLVQSKARLLTSENALSIREDFPEAVRRRRGGLVENYKQLRKNKKAILRSDKLLTDDGVFTYDLQQQMNVRLETPSFRRQQTAAGTHSDGGKTKTSSPPTATSWRV